MVTLQFGIGKPEDDGFIRSIETVTDHVSDIKPGSAKTKVEIIRIPDNTMLRKTYLPGQGQFFAREEVFNLEVENTGFSKKPRLLNADGENKIIDMEYVAGPNLEIALLEQQPVDFNELLDFILEEQSFLRQIPVTSDFVRNVYFSEVKRLLTSNYLDKRRKVLVNDMLEKAEYDPVVQKFGAEMSNLIWTPQGFIAIDYASPSAEHPMHQPLYLLTHFDRPRKKAFFEIKEDVSKRFYAAITPRLTEFFQGTGDLESTLKCALLDQVAENLVYGVHGSIQPRDDITPSYQKRVQALRDIVDLSVDDILQGKVRIGYGPKL